MSLEHSLDYASEWLVLDIMKSLHREMVLF